MALFGLMDDNPAQLLSEERTEQRANRYNDMNKDELRQFLRAAVDEKARVQINPMRDGRYAVTLDGPRGQVSAQLRLTEDAVKLYAEEGMYAGMDKDQLQQIYQRRAAQGAPPLNEDAGKDDIARALRGMEQLAQGQARRPAEAPPQEKPATAPAQAAPDAGPRTPAQPEQQPAAATAGNQPTAAAPVADDDKPFGAYKGKYFEASDTPRSQVRAAQAMLETLGKSTGNRNHAAAADGQISPNEMDGIVGENTDREIRLFQETHGLPVNGKIDAPTLAAMQKAVSEKQTQPGKAPTSPEQEAPQGKAQPGTEQETAHGKAPSAPGQEQQAASPPAAPQTALAPSEHAAPAPAPAPAAKINTMADARAVINNVQETHNGDREQAIIEKFVIDHSSGQKLVDGDGKISIPEQGNFQRLMNGMGDKDLADLKQLASTLQALGPQGGGHPPGEAVAAAGIQGTGQGPQTKGR